jgi:3-oxoacyl-[acyl-carrier protein] reductase
MTTVLNDETKAGILKQIPMLRMGRPEEVADVALFLASDMSSYISGQTISVCGAMTR